MACTTWMSSTYETRWQLLFSAVDAGNQTDARQYRADTRRRDHGGEQACHARNQVYFRAGKTLQEGRWSDRK